MGGAWRRIRDVLAVSIARLYEIGSVEILSLWHVSAILLNTPRESVTQLTVILMLSGRTFHTKTAMANWSR